MLVIRLGRKRPFSEHLRQLLEFVEGLWRGEDLHEFGNEGFVAIVEIDRLHVIVSGDVIVLARGAGEGDAVAWWDGSVEVGESGRGDRGGLGEAGRGWLGLSHLERGGLFNHTQRRELIF